MELTSAIGGSMETWVIATLRDYRPHWDAMVKIFKEEIPEVKGLKLAEGPGCGNIGLCLEDGQEDLVRRITMQVMPARYSKAIDRPWEGYINNTEPTP
jgi:hypothetical protein